MSVDKKVLRFLKDNPGATPREIADALGLPLAVIRGALTRLRESGYVIKSSRGGYLVRVSRLSDFEVSDIDLTDRRFADVAFEKKLLELIEELKKDVDVLKERVGKIESELTLLKLSLGSRNLSQISEPQRRESRKDDIRYDRLVSELKRRRIIPINEARNYAKYSIDAYVSQGIAVAIGNYLVDKEFFDEMRRKFPIRVSDVKKLSNEERVLLDAMVREGFVYLHGGREYRLIE